MTDLYNHQGTAGPLYVLDENNDVVQDPDDITGKWLLTADLHAIGGGKDSSSNHVSLAPRWVYVPRAKSCSARPYSEALQRLIFLTANGGGADFVRQCRVYETGFGFRSCPISSCGIGPHVVSGTILLLLLVVAQAVV